MSRNVKPDLSLAVAGNKPSAAGIADEKLFRLMVDGIKDYAMVMVDLPGLIISWNKGAELLFGYAANQSIGKIITMLFPSDSLDENRNPLNLIQSLSNNETRKVHYLAKSNKLIFRASVHCTTLIDIDNVVLGYSLVMHELPEMQPAELFVAGGNSSSARESLGKKHRIIDDVLFRQLVEHSISGVSLMDKDFNIIYRSPSAERINGWKTEDRIQSTMDDLIHPADLNKVKILFKSLLSNPGITKNCSFQSKHFNGHYVWLDCTYTNMLQVPGINAIVCNFVDVSEKKQSEHLLNQTVNELYAYKYALDVSAIVAITDQKGILTHVNDNFCRISKYSAEELIGHDHRIINSSYHDKAYIRKLWVTIANGNVWKGELKNKAKDGTFYWVDTTIVPFLNDEGKPYQYIAIRSDITERKLNEEKIIESEQFIKTITDNLPAMIAYWTADLQCRFANKPYSDWFGKTTEEMIGIRKPDLMDKDYSKYEINIDSVLKGEAISFERTFIKNNGTKIYTHTQYLPDEDMGEVNGFFSLIYDISEIKLAEFEVKKKNEQIADLLENITDGFIALDEKLCYTYANKKIAEMLCMPVELLLGRYIWDIFPDAVGSATYDAIETAHQENKYVINEDYYAPLNLWQENRVYPSGGGLSVFIRDISGRKREEEHLKLLESVITNATDAVMITEAQPLTNPGPPIIYVNEAFTKMTGYVAHEIIGKTPYLLNGPKTDIEQIERLTSSLAKNQPCEITTLNYKKDGTEFWVNISVSPLINERGLNTHFILIERDITRHKNEEIQRAMMAQSVRDTLKERDTILESIGDAFFTVDENWIVTYWNNVAEKLFKVPKNQIVGRSLWDVFSYAVGGESYVKYHEVATTKCGQRFEHYSDQQAKWLETSAYPAANGISVYIKDATIRKKAQIEATAALKERNTILESIGDAFFAVDKNWKVTYWNQTAVHVLGKTKAEMLDENLWEVFSESVNSESYYKYQQAIDTQEAQHFEDYYPPLNQWYEISAYPSQSGLSVYFKDITDRKTSELKLKILNEDLAKHAKELAVSNSELEQFAYVASHDLQEPLRMVTGFLTQLEKKYRDALDDKARLYINFAVDGAKRMRQIILDLLEFSRVGQMEDRLTEVDLNTLVDDILALHNKQISEKKAKIKVASLPSLQTYKSPLRQIFQNLIGNSLKYTKANVIPEIVIGCTELDNEWQFWVKDNGIGIDPEYFEKIFMIFQRLHNKEEYSGTGLGLALAKKILDNLGGKIWLTSQEGEGSTFYFTILKVKPKTIES